MRPLREKSRGLEGNLNAEGPALRYQDEIRIKSFLILAGKA